MPRRAFEPTERKRGEVRALAAAGYSHEQIAEYLGIAVKTLYKYFREELDRSAMTMIAVAVQGLYRAILDREAWAICFLLKTRAKHLGWTERVEVTGKDGERLFDLSKLTDEELSALEAITTKAAIAATAISGGNTGGTDQTHH